MIRTTIITMSTIIVRCLIFFLGTFAYPTPITLRESTYQTQTKKCCQRCLAKPELMERTQRPTMLRATYP